MGSEMCIRDRHQHQASPDNRRLNLFLTGRYSAVSENCCVEFRSVSDSDLLPDVNITPVPEFFPTIRTESFAATSTMSTPGQFTVCEAFVPNNPMDNFQLFRGFALSGGEPEMRISDNEYAVFRPGFTLNDLEAPVWPIYTRFVNPATSVLSVRLESQVGTPGLTKTLEMFDFVAGSYAEVGQEPGSFNQDETIVLNFNQADRARFIDGSGEVRFRVGWRQTGFIINFPWEVFIDLAGIEAECDNP